MFQHFHKVTPGAFVLGCVGRYDGNIVGVAPRVALGAGNPLAVVVKNEFTVVVGVEIQEIMLFEIGDMKIRAEKYTMFG
jgi:hypothetical protein